MPNLKTHPANESLGRLVETVLPSPYAGPERRTAPRRSVLIPVRVQRLNGEFEPTGEAEEALLCNISMSGAMYVHTQAMGSQYISLSFPEQYEIEPLIMEVVRNRPMGTYFEIAGTFLGAVEA